MRMSVVERDLGADKLAFLKAVGINHVCGDGPDGYGFDRLGYWDVAELEETPGAARRTVSRWTCSPCPSTRSASIAWRSPTSSAPPRSATPRSSA